MVSALQGFRLGRLVRRALLGAALAAGLTTQPASAITVSSPTVTEGTGAIVNATFTIQCEIGEVGSVYYVTSDDSAKQPADYQPASGNPSPTGCTAANSQQVNVAVVGDSLDEPTEKFKLTAVYVPALLGEADTAIGEATITDNDPPAAGISDGLVVEGNSGTATATFTVTLSSAPGGSGARVDYATADAQATAPADYDAASGTLEFAASETSKTIQVQVKGDTLDEGKAEGFHVDLSNPNGMALADAQGLGVIGDDDEPLRPTISIGDVSVVEGGAGATVPAVFKVILSAATTVPVRVSWKTENGSATLQDYLGGQGTLTFAPGETQKTVPITVKGEVRPEATEAFKVLLYAAENGTIGDGQGVGAIVDDDARTPVRDTRVPRMVIGKPTITKTSLTSKLRCPLGEISCRGTLTAEAGRLDIGSARFTIAGGELRDVKVRLNRAGRKLVAAGKPVSVRLTAVADDAAGNRGTRTKGFSVRLPRP